MGQSSSKKYSAPADKPKPKPASASTPHTFGAIPNLYHNLEQVQEALRESGLE